MAVGKKVLKKGKLKQFSRQLSNAFRQRADLKNVTRKMSTASKSEIEQNLNNLLHDWPELPEKAKIEIKKLRDVHLDCLANMSPHSGID